MCAEPPLRQDGVAAAGAGARPSVPLIVVTIFEGVMCLVSDPWGAPGVRSLLSGKMELQQQVLELVSAEGVDLVLLRIGRDKIPIVPLRLNYV